MAFNNRFKASSQPGTRLRRLLAALRLPAVGAGLCLIQAGCAVLYPAIDATGANCESYGVSERQRTPMNCALGADGLPLVTQLSFKEIQQTCVGDAPVSPSFYIWGCVSPRGENGANQAFAVDNALKVYRHEQCHCLLGPEHTDTY